MADTKGTDVVALRKIFREQGDAKEKEYKASLDSELAALYDNIIHTSMTPVEKQTALYEAAALVLFPGEPQHMFELGKAMARKSYSTVYKIFLRIPSIQYIIDRTATVWRSYHAKGEAEIRNYQGKGGSFVVIGYPDLPRKMREVIAGHLFVILEITGCKNPQVLVLDDNPQAWTWKLSWD